MRANCIMSLHTATLLSVQHNPGPNNRGTTFRNSPAKWTHIRHLAAPPGSVKCPPPGQQRQTHHLHHLEPHWLHPATPRGQPTASKLHTHATVLHVDGAMFATKRLLRQTDSLPHGHIKPDGRELAPETGPIRGTKRWEQARHPTARPKDTCVWASQVGTTFEWKTHISLKWCISFFRGNVVAFERDVSFVCVQCVAVECHDFLVFLGY